MVAVVLPDATVVDLVVEGGHATLRTLEADSGRLRRADLPDRTRGSGPASCKCSGSPAVMIRTAPTSCSRPRATRRTPACRRPVSVPFWRWRQPTTTEAATFRCALEAAAEAGGRGETAVLRLLIGDHGPASGTAQGDVLDGAGAVSQPDAPPRRAADHDRPGVPVPERGVTPDRRARLRLLADADVYSDW